MENWSFTSSYDFQNSECEEIVQKISLIMIKSQIAISRAFRKWRLRKLRKNNKFLLDIYFSTSGKEASEVSVIGEFAPKSWENNHYVCSNNYHTFTTADSIVNNVFKLNTSNILCIKDKCVKRKTSKLRKSMSKEETSNNFPVINKNQCTLKHTDSIKNELFSFNKICRVINANPQKSTIKSKLVTNSTKYCPKLRSPGIINSLNKPKLRKLSYNEELKVRNFDEKFQNGVSAIKVDTNAKCKCKNNTTCKKIRQSKSFNSSLNSVNKLSFSSIQCINSSNRCGSYCYGINQDSASKNFFSSTDDTSDDECQPQRYEFVSSGHIIPKTSSKPAEDAFFASNSAIGIADGVGGWSSLGIDASKFSNELMEKCKEHSKREIIKSPVLCNTPSVSSDESIEEEFEFRSNPITQVENSRNITFRNKLPLFSTVSLRKTISEPVAESDPVTILEKAYSETNSFGSSTACVCTLSHRNLKVANLGDSGFIVLRYDPELQKCEIIKESKGQQHNFNTPYQLAKIPFDKFKKIPANQFWNDKPSQSDKYNVQVKSGDIVILATDGLLDNLFTYEIIEEAEIFMIQNQCISTANSSISSKLRKASISSSKYSINSSIDSLHSLKSDDACILAKRLTQRAYTKAISEDCKSPFGDKVNNLLQQKARNYKYQNCEIHKWRSGKIDDIGVVVAFIS